MKVLHLIFHGIGEPHRPLENGEEKVWVARDGLRSILEAIGDRPDVELSFDDGNDSDVLRALPELVAHQRRATFFIVAGRLGLPGFLSADGVGELVAEGMNVQSHGMRHRVWRGLGDGALHEELVIARETLEDVIGRRITAVALPYCQYDRRTLRALRDHGYERVYSCDGGLAHDDSWLQARNQISRGEDARKLAELLAPGPRLRLERTIKRPIKRWR